MNKVKSNTPVLPMNIQFFAEDPVKPQEPAQQPATPVAPQQVQQPQAPAQPAVQPVQAMPQQQPTLQMPGNPMGQPQQQSGADILNVLNRLSQNVEGLQSQINTPAQPTAEQIQAENEALLEKFNSDPRSVLDKIQQQATERAAKQMEEKLSTMIQPMQQNMQRVQWSDAVRNFVAKNPQSQAYMSTMNNILAQNPYMMDVAKSNPKQALDAAYKMAVGQNMLGDSGNIADTVAQNDQLRTQIMSNPEVKQQIINEYLAGLNGGPGAAVPPIMGNSTTQPIAPTPVNRPTNVKESKAAAIERAKAYDAQRGV